MSAKCSSYIYCAPYIFFYPFVKTAEMMVQRVNFERNLKNIRPPTVLAFVKGLLQAFKGHPIWSLSQGSLPLIQLTQPSHQPLQFR